MARAALSLPFSGLSGALGDTVIAQFPDGPRVRARIPVRKGRTPAQDVARRRIGWVSRAWAALDDEAFTAWRNYAWSRVWRNPATGAIVTPKPYCLFVGLASKARQVNPSIDLHAFMPPARPFLGDGVTVVASLPEDPSEPGVIVSTDRANVPGVVTELLAQPLVNTRRATYRDKYVSQAFVAFDGEPVELALPAGAWALAYRFVRPDTGQETELVELGAFAVAGGA